MKYNCCAHTLQKLHFVDVPLSQYSINRQHLIQIPRIYSKYQRKIGALSHPMKALVRTIHVYYYPLHEKKNHLKLTKNSIFVHFSIVFYHSNAINSQHST